ncbi:hypothetical protein [Corallococcus terminator]|uniref:Uncharacterized protein n=1 Tax=Corallococcus terminator TaxID=2316733 RepID=A0A3A8J7J3_9BACT|nr:hypothetical protein [Corallococcus terminator]RKG91747.1 hypothetical protein D7V88_08695 [Corallococcus terminator]
MIYADEKVRQMARSLLPSTGRKEARESRASVHRAARHESRRELATWLRAGDLDADVPDCAPWRGPEIRQVKCSRREGDKVNPFIRWATARTRELPREERLDHVRALLPPGIIGEHALEHLEQAPAFEDPLQAARRERRRQLYARKPGGDWMDRGEQAQLLRALLLKPYGHATFNEFLRARYDATTARDLRASRDRQRATLPPHRPLLGMDDVMPFLDSLEPGAGGPHARNWGTWAPPPQWVCLFLHRFKQYRRIALLREVLQDEDLLPSPYRPQRARFNVPGQRAWQDASERPLHP